MLKIGVYMQYFESRLRIPIAYFYSNYKNKGFQTIVMPGIFDIFVK